jgi:hypothetical protein
MTTHNTSEFSEPMINRAPQTYDPGPSPADYRDVPEALEFVAEYQPTPPPADLSFGDHKSSARKPIIVDLVGSRYAVIPPKMRSAVRMFQQLQTAAAGTEENPDAAFDQYDSWITKLFRERAPEVIARLDDEDDELDLVHINLLTQALMARAAGADPTGSPSA